MKKKILWLTNIPSPYRVDFFNLLGKSVDLEVIFEREESTERNAGWYGVNFNHFSHLFLKGIKFGSDSSISFSVIKHLKNNLEFIFISNPMTPTGLIATTYLKIKKIPFVIEGDGGFPKYTEPIFKRIIKNFALKKATWYFSSGKSHTSYYEYYGVNKSKIISYHFSSTLNNDFVTKPLTQKEKTSIRKNKAIENKKIIIYVGQFVYRKGLDILFEALRDLNSNYLLLLVGDTQKAFQKLALNTTNVNYKILGFKSKEELKEYYDMSDFLVLPTREDIWGLVINEAFARGLPVISTNRCGAAVELVEDSKNGFIIESENINQLRAKINFLLSESLTGMKNYSLKKIKHYNLEKMVEDHINFINFNGRLTQLK
jgi:glycosyltransferase involved in cell wall biosynthesis